MNHKWRDKTILEKTTTIISCVAFCVWFVFELLKNKMQYAELSGCIALCVACLCEAVSFWRVKRSLSYVAIAGIVVMLTVVVLATIYRIQI